MGDVVMEATVEAMAAMVSSNHCNHSNEKFS